MKSLTEELAEATRKVQKLKKTLRSTCGERLRELRVKAGYTPTFFAENTGLSILCLHRYETGERMVSALNLNIMAIMLEVTPDYLLNGEQNV